jgi:hypothetical protein
MVLGIGSGAAAWVYLSWGMHEEFDPPLLEELARTWPGAVIFAAYAGLLGALLGALLRNLLFWRRLR